MINNKIILDCGCYYIQTENNISIQPEDGRCKKCQKAIDKEYKKNQDKQNIEIMIQSKIRDLATQQLITEGKITKEDLQ